MKLRAPAVPLITVDPYFSLWSMGDKLNESTTRHWTGHKLPVTGCVTVDGKKYAFMGKPDDSVKMEQKSLDITAFSTTYVFACDEITLTAKFTTPLLLDDLAVCSRPVSYIDVSVETADGKSHDTVITLMVDDALCQNFKYEFPTEYRAADIPGVTGASVGSVKQHILYKSGDDVRIGWGYIYATTNAKDAAVEDVPQFHEYGTPAHNILLTVKGDKALFAIAYDDIKSIEYFGDHLTSYWNKDGQTIESAISAAYAEHDGLMAKCEAFEKQLVSECPTEKYAELLSLAYRQAIAAHKIAVDKEGNVLFISKENFSNGCAATVDVTYPSIPLFLLYNPELVKGMLRPIFRYAESDEWFYEFAPHDAGQYPLVNGQVYSHGTTPYWQMPVEECGNMLVCVAAAAIAENDVSFAKENWSSLEKWCGYLVKNGLDPDNQLCTDDFAGHLAHNCNLALKAIMGIASFAILNKMDGNVSEYDKYMAIAKDMGKKWIETADDDESIFRLAFDQPGTYSMKYNAVWDKLFGTGIFPADTFAAEITGHIKNHTNKYGLVLDNREKYTKSDWLVWTATMTDNEDEFADMVEKLWLAYNDSESRVPLTDWYNTETGKQIGFQNRSVQGGLFIKLLRNKEICKFRG